MNIVNDVEFTGLDDEELDEAVQSDNVEELKRKLYYDAVLDCQNRTKFEEDIKDLQKSYTYFSLDINNLKLVNDTRGHEAGDSLLKVASEIVRQVWGDESVYRMGGDELAVLIQGTAQSYSISTEQVTHFKELLVEEDKKYEFPIAVSVGFATSDDADSFKAVIALADELMYADKKAYKEANPQYDMRKAHITPETLKAAMQNGDFHKAFQELRGEQEEVEKKEIPIIEEDLSFEGIASSPEPLSRKSSDLTVVRHEDLSEIAVASDELIYEANEINRKIQPVVKETTEKVVKAAIKTHNDTLKLEVAEVLDSEVSYRLSKYEKRRRRRDFKEKMSSIIKGVVILFVIVVVLSNAQLRLRFALLFQNIGDMIGSIMKGEETSSNRLVEDLFRDLEEDLNRVNTKEVESFNIEEE